MDADLRVRLFRLYGRGFFCTSCSTSSTKLRSLLLNLKGTKFGCGAGLCGACTVHLDGRAIRSCQTPVSTVASKQVTTLEGDERQSLSVRDVFAHPRSHPQGRSDVAGASPSD